MMLDGVVASLLADGVPASSAHQIYAPFIVAGPATWSDSWGAPRYGPGAIVREHHGQDVLCETGAPVLAAAVGRVEFDTGALGGLSATLHLTDGGALYYAHLSGWNPELQDGELVVPGHVLGYCGATGNASVPHVHFGSIAPDGSPEDPMPLLVHWLRAAEFRARFLGVQDWPGTSLADRAFAEAPFSIGSGFSGMREGTRGGGDQPPIGPHPLSPATDVNRGYNDAGLAMAILSAFVVAMVVRTKRMRSRSDA